MLTRNFYKLLNRSTGIHLRQFSPSSSGGYYPIVDLMNANGKYICCYAPAEADEDKYEHVDLFSDTLNGDQYNSDQYGITVLDNPYEQSITESGTSRTLISDISSFTITNDINTDTEAKQRSKIDGGGCLVPYLGNGTTQPTKDDYTMESCLTAYERMGLIVSSSFNDGLTIITFTIKPTEDLQLSEIGIFSVTGGGSSSRNIATKSYSVMVCHDVFTPVTLPANKAVTITYTINLSELTAETTIG